MLYYAHPACFQHAPGELLPGHPERPERLEAIEAALEERDWLGWERRLAPAAEAWELELIHSSKHVEAVRELSVAGGGAIDADTLVGEASYQAALHAAGAACAMARDLLDGQGQVGFCGVRPPGHHAEPERAMGFCLFNSIAVAAALAIEERGLERVLVLDWDVHHGNGTAEAFRRRSDVLYVSLHQKGIYPGTGALNDLGSGPGAGYTVNLPVPAGAGEELWLSLLEHIAMPIAHSFDPQLVLISAGFDAHRADPLAGCELEAGSFAQMSCHVRDLAASLGVPVGAVLEGGYEPRALAESVLATMAALGGDGDAILAAPEEIYTSRAATYVAPYWSL